MAPAALFAAAWLLLLIGRPGLYGASLAESLAHALFLAAYVALPGCLVYRRLREPEEDDLSFLGMGCALGYALQALVYVGLKLAGAAGWFPLWPLVPILLAAWKRAPASIRPAPTGGAARRILLLALVFVAIERTRLVEAAGWWREQSPDLFFHAGNAAELLRRWPFLDPRVAGEPNNYHFLVYALPAGASQVCGFTVADWFQRLGPGVLPSLLALQAFNLGRAYGGSAAAGLVTSAIVLLHADPMAGMEVLWPSAAGAFRFNSFLDTGIYRSLPTVGGLVLFASLAIAVRRLLLSDRAGLARCAGLAALLSAAASGIKGSVMPVAAAALVPLALRDRRARLALFVVALAAAPMTLYLVAGEGSRASATFHPWLGEMSETSGFFRAAAAGLGADPFAPPFALRVALLPFWIAGYLGLAGLGGLLWAARAGRPWGAPERWLLLALGIGLALAVSLSACGHSQMFFVLPGQVALAALAGGAIASLAGRRSIAWAAALLLAALPMGAASLREIRAGLRRDIAPADRAPPLAEAWREGLDWVRDRTEDDAVLLVDHRWILVSVLAERRAFLETLLYTPGHVSRRWHKRLWGLADGDPDLFGADLRRLQARLFAGPDPAALEELRARLPPGTPIYLLRDDVSFAEQPGRGFHLDVRPAPRGAPPIPGAELAFENDALALYRLPADPRR